MATKACYGDINETYLPVDRLQKFSFNEFRDRVDRETAKAYVPS